MKAQACFRERTRELWHKLLRTCTSARTPADIYGVLSAADYFVKLRLVFISRPLTRFIPQMFSPVSSLVCSFINSSPPSYSVPMLEDGL